MTARLLVSGSRKHNRDTLHIIAAGLVEAGRHLGRDTVLVHGGQGYRDLAGYVVRGADLLAAEIWERWGLPTEEHPADWDGPCRPTCRPNHRMPHRGMTTTYCPAAGNYRNQAMVDLGATLYLGFPWPGAKAKSGGTWDCYRRAKAAGIQVWIRP